LIKGTLADPKYWTEGLGFDFITHLQSDGFRLVSWREDPEGTFKILEEKALDLPVLNAVGATEREEARKAAAKKAKLPPKPKVVKPKPASQPSGQGSG
jgi:hypothetical protein